ncbi:hypothetical protein HXX76_004041 [Chlamydomonas incerta]|uniref:Cilia- and flagella-associated protein 57 n=1 Tax=Chlamydomonas incerta TaxID=51695 RepID=A0A835TA74_CHLIN|nr:hypothetical protein HXX76_004041 [Chlamydomonas incerta]|eukprot:KAG2439922.1 hypothetical protein HXX76_004041 [Chlamydomonas incerta]
MLWSVGAQVAIYNTISQEMRFIPLAERGARALVLAVASNCKYFAAVERVPGMEHDQVSVYSFGGEKRVKSLPHDAALSGSESARVECIDFSENSKFLLTQYGNPDWTLVVWRWYSGKVLARMRLDLNKPVLSAQFSPTDDMLLAVLTPNSVTQLRLDPDSDMLRQMAAPPAWEAPHLTAMCWLAGNLVALVGSGGEVYVFQDASARITTRAEPLPSAASASALLLGHPGAAGGGGGLGVSEHLLAVTARGRGFIAAGTSGTVYFFDPPGVDQKRAGIRDLYALTRRLAVELPPGPPRPITWLSVSAGEEEVAAVTAGGDVYVANMTLVAEREEKPIVSVVGHEVLDGEPFRRVLGGFLTGRVVGLAAASSVPLVAAACLPSEPLSARTAAGQAAAAAASASGTATGTEGGGLASAAGPTRGGFTASGLRAPPPLPPQLRVWNYESRRCVVSAALEEDPTCLDMHPGGQLVLLGLCDKVALYSIALDHLDQVYESHIKRATCVRFSTGGAMFAAVGRNNAITLTATYPFRAQQQLGQLKGHATAVTELAFSVDDRMLVSAGVGGALYFWDLATLNRVVELEHVDKQSVYCGVAMCSHTRGGAVVRCLDGRAQQVANGKVEYEVTCKGGTNAPSLMLGADKVYLAADDQGCVVSHAWPGEELPPRPGFAALAPPPTHYPLHSAVGGGISRMALVPSRGLLFTANGDGTVLMSNVALVLDGVLLEAALAGGPGHGHGHGHGHSHAGSMRPSVTSIAGPLAVGAAAGGPTGGGVLAAPYMVTVPDERLQALRDKVVEVAMLVGSARSEAEYQAFRASQVLRDAITRLEGELAAVRAALSERDAVIARLTEDSRHVERRVVKELEGAHMSAAEELEVLYEKRLAVEADKLRVMAAARDDAQYRAEEVLRRLQEQHKLDIKDLQAAHAAQLVAVEARMAAAAETRAEQDRFFAEYVKQAEEDFEDHSERINDKITAQAEAAESREQRLKADNNILKRTNLRLKADKTIDLKKMDKLTTDNTALREQAEELKLTIAKLTKELEERDAVNADNYATIQQLRRKVQDLEKHKFVLSYKAETYAKALEPQEKEVSRLQSELEGHDRELLGHMSKMQVLSRHVAEKDTALRTLKSELGALKSKAGQMEAAINAFSQDLYEAMQQPDDRGPRGKSARQKALDELVRRYCLGDMRVGGRDEAMEAAANAAAAETRVVLLQWRLEQERGSSKATQRATLHQNSQLLRELQVSQGDLRALKDRYDAAWVALRELQSKYNLLERRWGASQGGDAVGGGAAGEQEAEDVLSEGAGNASVVSMAGRVLPSRPASGVPSAGAVNSMLTGMQQALAQPGRGALAAATTHHTHLHGSGGAKGTRPASAVLARPVSAGWGMYRSVGGQPAPGGLVSRGTPLRAYAELISSERQRMEELAVALAEGSAGLEAQQRALLGLREQLAANGGDAGGPTAGGEVEHGGLAFGGFSVVSEGRESLDEDADEGGEAAVSGRGTESDAPGMGLDAGLTNDAALRRTSSGNNGASTSLSMAAAHDRPSTAQSAGGRRWAGASGSGGGGAASTSAYHAPGLRGLTLGQSHNAKHRPFSARTGAGVSASLDASRAAAGLRTRSLGVHGAVRTASSPSPAGLAAPLSPGGGSGGSRRRPTTAAGVGLRAFTDSAADRFRAPGVSAEGELPF